MARARLLKPEFFRDEDLAALPMAARLLFAGLWTLADREGRLEDRPRKIKADLFPFDADVDVAALLALLATPRDGSPGSFVTRYAVGGRNYLQVNAFSRHQNPHVREPKGAIPGPDHAESVPSTRPAPGQHRASRAESVTESESVTNLAAPPAPLDLAGMVGALDLVPEGLTAAEYLARNRKSAGLTDPKPARAGKATWLTPYLAAWSERTGGDLPPKRASAALGPLHTKHGDPEALARWRIYLAATAPAYASPERFAATYGTWAHPPANGRGNWDTPEASERARALAREPDPVRVTPSPAAVELWQRIQARLKGQMPERWWSDWIKPTHGVTATDRLVVAVPGELHRAKMPQWEGDVIAAAAVEGHPVAAVEWIVAEVKVLTSPTRQTNAPALRGDRGVDAQS